MKVRYTLGQIEDGLKRGLTFERIAKECGNKDYKKAGKEIESQYNELKKNIKKAWSAFKDAMKTIEEKERLFIKDNKGLEGELETTINDFSFYHVPENLRLSTVDELLKKSTEDHVADLTKWAVEKMNKRKGIVRKTKAALKVDKDTKHYHLEQAHKKNGGRLTNSQIKELAEEKGFSYDSMRIKYRQIEDRLKP